MGKTIAEWQAEVHALAVAKGWHERPMRDENGKVNVDAVAAKLALVHSEISEALEALRDDPRDLGICVSSKGKPEGFVVELADAVIRILDLAEALGVDVELAMMDKHAFNQTRPHRHNGKSL